MNYYIEITLILSFIFFILWLFSNKQNKKYRPGKLLLWVYGNAGIFVMFVISLVITFYFIN